MADDDTSDGGVADVGLWDSAQDAEAPDEPIEVELGSEQPADAIVGDGPTEATDDQVDAVSATPGPDPLQPMLLERFEQFVGEGRFGLAFHLSRAASEAALFDAFPLTGAELRLAAISGHVSHAALQGSPFVHELLRDVHTTFSEMEDEAPHAVARRILALGSLAEFALFQNDPEGKDALEDLRNVADGLGDAVHVFREALGAPLKHGLNLSPALMRAAGEEAKDDENARRLIARILSDIEDFSNKTYKFQLGNKLRNVLTKSDGELGRLRDRVAKGGSSALEATREFATSYRDRGQIIDLLAVAEIRANNFKMTGIDGIARDRMVGLIQGIAATCAEYVDITDAAPAIKRTLANIQRDRTAIVDATTALDAALERFESNGALEEGAVRSARRALAGFLDLVRGVGRTPQPTDHLAAVHAPLLWVPTLDFGLGWLPSPYVPETVLELLVHSDPADLSEPVSPEAFAGQVRDRISVGSHIPAAMMLSLGDYYSIPAEDVQGLQEFIRTAIEQAVPHGRVVGRGKRDNGSWGSPPAEIVDAWATLAVRFARITDKYPRLKNTNNLVHLGTLGTGNHFIELCLDTEGRVWVMLHSGSRGVGNAIGTFFIELAKQDMRKWFINLPDEDLAYFPEGTDHFADYVEAVGWAQDFAALNRRMMMANVIKALRSRIARPFDAELEAVNCHHNYVSREKHFGENLIVTRKGAVRAAKGTFGIIPGSMGAKSFIVRGLGNAQSFESCSHGAGRVMSRTAAKKLVTLDEHVADTAGVECRKDEGVIDETPKAYKPIEAVMAAQADLVEIVHTLKQVVCVKG